MSGTQNTASKQNWAGINAQRKGPIPTKEFESTDDTFQSHRAAEAEKGPTECRKCHRMEVIFDDVDGVYVCKSCGTTENKVEYVPVGY